MRLYVYFLMLLTCSIVTLAGCNDNDTHDAILVVESFHELFNSEDFNGIYTDVVSKEFKESMTKSDYFALMEKNLSVLGEYQYGRLLKSDQVKLLIGENKINISYHSTYANYELFVIKKEGGRNKITQIVMTIFMR